jgi:hypothetical protein
MEQKQILKQILDFQQTTFNNAYSATALLQDQYERMANTILNQATWIPAEGRKAIDGWVDAYKSGRENYKKYVEDSYKKAEELLV